MMGRQDDSKKVYSYLFLENKTVLDFCVSSDENYEGVANFQRYR